MHVRVQLRIRPVPNWVPECVSGFRNLDLDMMAIHPTSIYVIVRSMQLSVYMAQFSQAVLGLSRLY